MNTISILILACLIKINIDDLRNKYCNIIDLLILSILFVIKSGLLRDLSANTLQDNLKLIAKIYLLPILLNLFYLIPSLRLHLGAGDIVFLYAVAPIVPYIQAFRVLLLASLLALFFATFNYLTNGDKKIAFIPYLTLAVLLSAC